MSAARGLPGRPTGAKFESYKLVLLGESAVGKSSVVLRFVKNQFDEYRESTIGAAFLTQTVPLPEQNFTVKFEIWDTAGQERYRSLAPMYYRNAESAVVVYDITQKDSLAQAKRWLNEIAEKYRNQPKSRDTTPRKLPVALLGNKADLVEGEEQPATQKELDEANPPLKRKIHSQIGKELAQECNADVLDTAFFETSAKTGANVQEVFTYLASKQDLEKGRNKNNRLGAGSGTVDMGRRTEQENTQGGQGCQC